MHAITVAVTITSSLTSESISGHPLPPHLLPLPHPSTHPGLPFPPRDLPPPPPPPPSSTASSPSPSMGGYTHPHLYPYPYPPHPPHPHYPASTSNEASIPPGGGVISPSGGGVGIKQESPLHSV